LPSAAQRRGARARFAGRCRGGGGIGGKRADATTDLAVLSLKPSSRSPSKPNQNTAATRYIRGARALANNSHNSNNNEPF
jgi:hypothetical protein